MKRNLVIATLAALALGTSTAAIAQAAGPGARIIAVTNVVEIPQVNSCKDTSILNRATVPDADIRDWGPWTPVAANVGDTVKFPDESVHEVKPGDAIAFRRATECAARWMGRLGTPKLRTGKPAFGG
ncbi:MAG: hypothetical protein AAB665_01425 [Patescibacteria group bacterium]